MTRLKVIWGERDENTRTTFPNSNSCCPRSFCAICRHAILLIIYANLLFVFHHMLHSLYSKICCLYIKFIIRHLFLWFVSAIVFIDAAMMRGGWNTCVFLIMGNQSWIDPMPRPSEHSVNRYQTSCEFLISLRLHFYPRGSPGPGIEPTGVFLIWGKHDIWVRL